MVERREKAWSNENSKACNALVARFRGKYPLKDLQYLKNFGNTGNMEVFHSLCNKHCPKKLQFSFNGIIGRTQLAILDCNVGIGLQ